MLVKRKDKKIKTQITNIKTKRKAELQYDRH